MQRLQPIARLRSWHQLPRLLHHIFPPHTSIPPSSLRSVSSNTTRGLRSIPAWFVRGGTSNGLILQREALPPGGPASWHDVLPAAMGSPDPLHGRQLDGIGSGLSSTSKVVVVSRPMGQAAELGVDVEFTFVQVGIRDGGLDVAGNCGNMSAMVGPSAWDMGLVPEERKSAALLEVEADGTTWAQVRIFNTNTSKVMTSRFRVQGEPPMYCPEGDYTMDGVPGTQSPITMSFLDPGGAKTGKALPTGNRVDELHLDDGSIVEASLVDAGNPGVFVATSSLGLDTAAARALSPAVIEADPVFKSRLEQIRRAGASAMGLDPNIESVPKIVLLLPPSERKSPDIDIQCVAMSMGQAHKAVPLTLALCLGAASQLEGTIPARLLTDGGKKEAVRIGHPSGMVDVGTKVGSDGSIQEARLLRTGRVLMKGEVYY